MIKLNKLYKDQLSTLIKGFSIIIKQYLNDMLSFIKRNYVLMAILSGILFLPVILQPVVIQLKLNDKNKFKIEAEEIFMVKSKLEKEIKKLEGKIISKMPKSYYLIINSASNEFTLYKGKQIIKTDKCSTGSYVLLKNGEQQQWMFNTPKGEFKIQSKTTSPVWKKPDWAFVEEGLPVPPANHYSRFEYGVLGDYALNLGKGYLIHGTLYQRFLGLPVTHGCIRLNDENLELVYDSLSIGSKVYIF